MIVLNSQAVRRQALMTTIALAVLTAACTSNSNEGSKPTSPQSAPRHEAAMNETTGEVPQPILALFRDDLARRALVKPETITVASATAQDWPDGAMGCPKPGEMYMQMIVPGYRVVLQANGEKYAYHSDQRGRFIVCANGLALPPA